MQILLTEEEYKTLKEMARYAEHFQTLSNVLYNLAFHVEPEFKDAMLSNLATNITMCEQTGDLEGVLERWSVGLYNQDI